MLLLLRVRLSQEYFRLEQNFQHFYNLEKWGSSQLYFNPKYSWLLQNWRNYTVLPVEDQDEGVNACNFVVTVSTNTSVCLSGWAYQLISSGYPPTHLQPSPLFFPSPVPAGKCYVFLIRWGHPTVNHPCFSWAGNRGGGITRGYQLIIIMHEIQTLEKRRETIMCEYRALYFFR